MFGVVLIQKPAGATSHDIVNDVRRRFRTRRVGHAGTLDPLATGLLVVAVGPATRFLQFLPLEPKEYEATIRFGVSTNTYDAEGERGPERLVPADLLSTVEAALPAFRGLISQIPPAFSAIKRNGKPLYHYARQGLEVVREPRTVHIAEFTALEADETTVRARIVCSGGTYIRSLAHDLGETIGCGAYLEKLIRTRVGRFHLREGTPLAELAESDIVPLREALHPMPMRVLSAREVEAIRFGRSIPLSDPPEGGIVCLLDPDERVVSVARINGNEAHPECVIPSETYHGLLTPDHG